MFKYERKFQAVVISEVDMIEIAQRYCNDSDLPDNCEVVSVNYNFERQAFVIKVYHKDFEPLVRGSVLPHIKIEPVEKE